MGITLQAKVEPVDTPLTIKSEKLAKLTYMNGDLPFENYSCNLKDWQHKFIPDLCDWAGTIEEPFIGKQVLVYLKNLFANKPFNNNASKIQEYVAANLIKVTFIYCDQKVPSFLLQLSILIRFRI